MLQPSSRTTQADMKFDSDVEGAAYETVLFLRLVAKGRKFTKVSFKYSIFDACYLRDCIFDSCDLIGCRFVGSNLHGTKFEGCKFDYCTFERTNIDSSVLDDGCPSTENLALKFARTLRMNYQQLGDAQAANKAIAVELKATATHLHKAAWSKEAYYRKKYKDTERIYAVKEWVFFRVLDFVWGNGESAWKLLRTAMFALLAISLVDATRYRDWTLVLSYVEAVLDAPAVFFGVHSPPNWPKWYLALIAATRLVLFGFFMSIVIKRFNRR